MQKVDLIIHPVRFRILQVLTAESLTTQGIATRLPDVPKSSIYRHLKMLMDGNLVEVSDVRMVNGIQEKTYQLAQRPHLGQGDMGDLKAGDHLRYFTTYLMTVLRDFNEYLKNHSSASGTFDLLADRTGYTEVSFFSTNDELDVFQATINEALKKLINNQAGEERHRHKIALVTHPVPTMDD